MTISHTLGFPRIGRDRELKRALERYWRAECSEDELRETGKALRASHWRIQAQAGIELLPVGDFAWYDQVLTHTLMVGAVPPRFRHADDGLGLDTLFAMGRGLVRAECGCDGAQAQEMTKWFDTNYHYLVPELEAEQRFHLGWHQLFEEVEEAIALGYRVKPVLLGPLTYLWLSKCGGREFDKLALLDRLLPVYHEIFTRLAGLGVDWVQIDEPALVLDLPDEWRQAYRSAYHMLRQRDVKLLLTTYFGPLEDNLELAAGLPVDGLHLDLVRGDGQLDQLLSSAAFDGDKVLSLGVVDGRNVWRCDLDRALEQLARARHVLNDRLWVAPSCSLLHVPVDLERETGLDDELRQWLAFAIQKCAEVALLTRAARGEESDEVELALRESRAVQSTRSVSRRIHRAEVKARVEGIRDAQAQRSAPFAQRIEAQRGKLALPKLPTTTIGSFPQTSEVRRTRSAYRQGRLGEADYLRAMRDEIGKVVAFQERVGLDVLVHGEPERNDMVEYFAEQLEGYLITRFGWVQSYGSRCVKPAIIYGDITRPAPMTVDWISYAQSLSKKPMKGMLTGPVTMLAWSFPREDICRETQAQQLALALRDEVCDLEAAGIDIIQIDEAAFREILPLRRRDWQHYLDWAVKAFRIASSGVKDSTQIHTHMCYSEFNQIIEAIAAMDADVITIETSRSQMELLRAFEAFEYPNQIGPGVYDIHSPRVPSVEEMVELLEKAAAVLPVGRLWVNPDCGLKTRGWPETEAALVNMVDAARSVRRTL